MACQMDRRVPATADCKAIGVEGLRAGRAAYNDLRKSQAAFGIDNLTRGEHRIVASCSTPFAGVDNPDNVHTTQSDKIARSAVTIVVVGKDADLLARSHRKTVGICSDSVLPSSRPDGRCWQRQSGAQ